MGSNADDVKENTTTTSGWKGKVSQEWLENRLSKRLCYILRYGALKEGLHVDDSGFVELKELATVNLLRDHTEDEILEEIQTSTSGRKTKRFEWKKQHEKIYVRALYARRMEKNPHHEDCKVPTLFESCITTIMTHIEEYDLEDFPEEFIINTMIHRLKREKKMNNKALQTLLVPTLHHLDLEGLYLTNNILRAVWTKCPHLTSLSLKDCGYIVTDNILSQLVKKLPNLDSLNLAKCQYLTDTALKSLKKNCTHLQNLNISMIKSFSEAAMMDFILNTPTLEHLDIYNMKISSEGRRTLAELGQNRKLKIVLRGFVHGETAQENPSEMLPNFGQVWY